MGRCGWSGTDSAVRDLLREIRGGIDQAVGTNPPDAIIRGMESTDPVIQYLTYIFLMLAPLWLLGC